ncbi:hypothetical protein ACFSQT_14225 [Mesorhizobium calcicola]|uniref:Yip1 domain-containing protein n=1 Tax=Mesorhizobium calcicola TaxID=1300310 RepID=A0ABW4WDU4_9HYPH
MEAKGVTNLLLAIIAGVLLFGHEAMVGGIWWVVILGIGIGILFAILMFASYLIRETAKTYRETKTWREAGINTMGLIFMVIVIPLMGYAGLLWLEGVHKPMDAAMASLLGTVWMYVLFGAFGVMALLAASDGIQWLVRNRRDLPGYALLGAKLACLVPVAPIVLPVYAWRKRRQGGTGVLPCAMSSAYGLVEGLAVWFGVLMVGIIALLALGVIK